MPPRNSGRLFRTHERRVARASSRRPDDRLWRRRYHPPPPGDSTRRGESCERGGASEERVGAAGRRAAAPAVAVHRQQRRRQHAGAAWRRLREAGRRRRRQHVERDARRRLHVAERVTGCRTAPAPAPAPAAQDTAVVRERIRRPYKTAHALKSAHANSACAVSIKHLQYVKLARDTVTHTIFIDHVNAA